MPLPPLRISWDTGGENPVIAEVGGAAPQRIVFVAAKLKAPVS